MQILVSGSLAIDRIMTFNGRFGDHIVPERVHQINLSFKVDGFNAYFGGTAGNIAYSLAMLGQEPRIVAAIGSDYRDYFNWMADNSISTSDIRIVDEEATASAFIFTDLADNQITAFNPGAMMHATGFDFGSVNPADTINIVGPGNSTDMTDFTANGCAAGIYTIFDPGQSLPSWEADGLTACIANSHLLIANDYEMALISEKTGRDDAGLLELTGVLVTTLGEQGVRVTIPEGQAIVPPVPTDNVVDPTGAERCLPRRADPWPRTPRGGRSRQTKAAASIRSRCVNSNAPPRSARPAPISPSSSPAPRSTATPGKSWTPCLSAPTAASPARRIARPLFSRPRYTM